MEDKEFDDWFESAFEWKFGMKWLKPIAKHFARQAWKASAINSKSETVLIGGQ